MQGGMLRKKLHHFVLSLFFFSLRLASFTRSLQQTMLEHLQSNNICDEA